MAATATVRMRRDDVPLELDALMEWVRQATSARWRMDGELESATGSVTE